MFELWNCCDILLSSLRGMLSYHVRIAAVRIHLRTFVDLKAAGALLADGSGVCISALPRVPSHLPQKSVV